jgi:poly(3-hydroxybutyrate) depolymerase
VQQGVGHYGVFNGTRWRTEIQPRIREFIRSINYKRMTGSETTRIPRPYRVLTDTPDVAPDWRKKASLNGVNGKHPPAAAGE